MSHVSRSLAFLITSSAENARQPRGEFISAVDLGSAWAFSLVFQFEFMGSSSTGE